MAFQQPWCRFRREILDHVGLSICDWQAEAGDPAAQYNLGRMYSEDCGVTQDLATGAAWYEQAAKHGKTEAQFDFRLSLTALSRS